MTKAIPLLAVLLGALVAADLALSKAGGETRRRSSKVRRLVPPAEREAERVAVLKLEGGGRFPPMVYAREAGGFWRCRTYHGALASEALVESVRKKLFEGGGVVQSVDPAKAPSYGLDMPAMVRLSVHGPRGLEAPEADRILSLDVGAAAPSMSGGYVRRTGEGEIWSVDVNLREELAPQEPTALPPLVERTLFPTSWPGAKKGIRSFRIEPGGAEAFELEGRPREVSPEEMRSGKSPWQWFVKTAAGEQPANEALASSYAAFLQRAPRLDVAEAGLEPQAGLGAPMGKVTLIPNEGDPLVVTVGSGRIGASVPVKNSFGQTLDLAAPLVAPLLVPRAEQLLQPAGANPWEPFLKER
ncbi:MAG TPA: hypothetical protein VFI25_02775 [Planctomycetota bacterium]|nr:hypothetical protein [Planctomycetota bacterium]